MKKISFYFLAVICSISLFSLDVDAQAKKRKAPPVRRNTKRRTTAKPFVTAPVDSVPVVAAADSFSVPLPKVLPSLRPSTAARPTVDTNGRKTEKTPLAYENLREDDQLYKQVIWRNINIKEKMNLPFGYEADEDNGNQRFINIILNGIKDGVNDTTPLTVFNGLDDRFTKPMTLKEVSDLLVGGSYTIQKPDISKDPDGSKGIFKDTLISDAFNPETIETYQIKEEIIFDKKTSRLHFRILGIAPMKKALDALGNVRGEFALFWIYYPDLRPLLAKFEAYNPRNAANRLSWEEVFESRYFSSYIVKSTLNNNSNRYIAGTIQDPILRLVESDNIKDQIFNFEQSQWSY